MIKILPKPHGKDSLDSLKKWFDDFTKDVSDTRSIWKDLTPDIKNAIDSEFSDSNPNGWDSLQASYKATKIRQGFPPTIGVRTGSLRDAASKYAKVVFKPLGLNWELNENISSGQFGSLKNMTTGDYAKYFDKKREIYVYTLKWLEGIGKQAVKEYIKESAGDAAK